MGSILLLSLALTQVGMNSSSDQDQAASSQLVKSGVGLHNWTNFRSFFLDESDSNGAIQVCFGRDWKGGGDDFRVLRKLPNVREIVIVNQEKFSEELLEELTQLPDLESFVFFGPQLTDRGLASIARIKNLKSLSLQETSVTDKGMNSLSDKIALQYLRLTGTKITDEGLVKLKNLRNLKMLYLDDTRASCDGLVHLQELTKLQKLHLPRSRKRKEGGLKHLAKMSDMRVLVASGLGVTNEELGVTGNMPRLEELHLNYSQVTDEGMAHLGRLKNLRHLRMMQAPISSEGVKNLEKLEKLEHLDFGDCGIGDSAATSLSKIRQLRYLEASGTKMTAKGIAELEKENPKLSINQ